MAEVGDGQCPVAEHRPNGRDLLVRKGKEFGQESELVDQLQRRWVDGVAAEITEEVRMLLEHHHVDAGAGEQEPQHHAGGSAPGDTTGRFQPLRHPYARPGLAPYSGSALIR